MGIPVAFTPQELHFGGVTPGSEGPNISVDPSFGPPGISFAGGVQIKEVPANANVTAFVEGDSTFKVRDIIIMEWVLEPVDPSELPPHHHGPIPKVRVLEVVAQSDGLTPVAVQTGQFIVVRARYTAPSTEGLSQSVLVILGDTWNRIEVPLSLFPSGVLTRFLNTPVMLPQGKQTIVPIEISVVAGPNTTVQYAISRTQLDSGITLLGASDFPITKVPQRYAFTMSTAIDAPLGDNTLAIDQTAFNIRKGLLVPVRVTSDPEPDEARTAIARKAAEKISVLGNPTSLILKVLDPNGLPILDSFVQQFEHGDIYYTPTLGAHEVHGEIKTKYDLMGGPNGILSFPESDVTVLADRRGQFCDFHAASIYMHPDIGPRVVADPIRQSWRSRGAESGRFGYPVRDHYPLRITIDLALPNPNGVAWGTFENGAIVTSEEGTLDALVAPAPIQEQKALDGLKTFVRGQFETEFRKSPDNVGLHPEIEILGVLPYEHDFSQSTARAIVFRLHGFHDNGLAGDTDFTIDIGIRIGWKLDPVLQSDTRMLNALLVKGFPVVNIIGGPGGDTIRDKVTAKIREFFANGVPLNNVPVITQIGSTSILVVVDLIVGADGGLLLLVNPEQRNIVAGGGPLGPALRDQTETFLLKFLTNS